MILPSLTFRGFDFDAFSFAQFLTDLPHHIREVIWFETKAIGVMAGLTFLLLVFRLFRERRMSSLKRHHSMLIVNDVLNFSLDENSVSLIQRGRFYQLANQRAQKECLLDHLHLLVGAERKYLAERYVALGFAEENLKNCESMYWWTRLKAAAEIGNLALPQYADTLHRLLDDANPYVSIAARIGLSGIAHPLNSPELLKNLSFELLQRGNVLLEIAKHLGELHGVDVLIPFFRPGVPEVVRESCLSAVISLKAEGTTDVVVKLLQDEGGPSANMIAKSIAYLRKVSDSSHQPLIASFMKHPDSQVRLEAAQWFLIYMDEPSLTDLNTLSLDANLRIQEYAEKTLNDSRQAETSTREVA